MNLETSSFVPVLKSVVGISVNRQKSLSISAWYQHALSNDAANQIFEVGVGLGLAYFFDWSSSAASWVEIAVRGDRAACKPSAPNRPV